MIYTADLETLKPYHPTQISIQELRKWEIEWIKQNPDYTTPELIQAIREAFPPQENQ